MKFLSHGGLTVDDWRLLTSEDSPLRQKELLKLGRVVPKMLTESIHSATVDEFGFEEVGQIAGFWFGMVWGLATLPVVALDGPLPIMDAAWLASWGAFTLRAIALGGKAGSFIDDQLD